MSQFTADHVTVFGFVVEFKTLNEIFVHSLVLVLNHLCENWVKLIHHQFLFACSCKIYVSLVYYYFINQVLYGSRKLSKISIYTHPSFWFHPSSRWWPKLGSFPKHGANRPSRRHRHLRWCCRRYPRRSSRLKFDKLNVPVYYVFMFHYYFLLYKL